MYASVYVRLVDRKERSLSVDAMSAQLRERLRSVPGITVTHVGLLDSVGGNKQVEFSLQGDDLAELERLTQQVMERIRPIVGLVDLDASVKPDKPTVDVKMRRELASDAGPERRRGGQQPAHPGGRPDGGQLARGRRRELRRERAAGARAARAHQRPGATALRGGHRRRRHGARGAPGPGGRRWWTPPARTRSTGAT